MAYSIVKFTIFAALTMVPRGHGASAMQHPASCPGISIGNAGERPLSALLAGYSPWRHPIIRQLAGGGPAALAEMARSMGYPPKANYGDECHLCYDVRRFLRPRYPSELAPPLCYEAP